MLKKTILILFVLFLSYFNIVAAPIKGAGALSCGNWIKERSKGTYFLEINWILGFISAYNHYLEDRSSSNGVFGSVDSSAIELWMDNYCRNNPLSNPYEGTVDLIEELKTRIK